MFYPLQEITSSAPNSASLWQNTGVVIDSDERLAVTVPGAVNVLGVVLPLGATPNTAPNAVIGSFAMLGDYFKATPYSGRLWIRSSGAQVNNIKITRIGELNYSDAPVIDEVELDRLICREATGGPGGSTTVLGSNSAVEQRGGNWPASIRDWRIMWVARWSDPKFRELVAFFEARRWQTYGFRFFDWTDHDDWDNGKILWVPEQNSYQLFKLYPDEVRPTLRKIYKPILGTVMFYADNVPVDGVLDYATGRVDWANNLYGGAELTWTGQFNIPARFATEKMRYRTTPDEAVIWEGVDIVELV